MKISEAIAAIKHGCRGQMNGKPCNDDRDKILYGAAHAEDECTGIVACVYGSLDVVREAACTGANLLVVVEPFFWSHGDPTDWLEGNPTFEAKRAVLDQRGIVVWRLHEYLRSGVPHGTGYVDPVNYGFARRMGWTDRISERVPFLPQDAPRGLDGMWMYLDLDGQPARDVARAIRQEFGSNAVPIVGDPETPVHTLYAPPGSVLGAGGLDEIMLEQMERDGVDAMLGLELVDFSMVGYVRDSCAVGRPRAILHVGHFVMEEAAMCYAPEWMAPMLGEGGPAVTYVNSGDPYDYLGKEDAR